MDLQALIDVNKLWYKIYPYTSEHALSHFGKKSGKVLEMGVFSGGITKYLAENYHELELNILTDDKLYSDAIDGFLKNDCALNGINVYTSPLDKTSFENESYDFVILRGAYFFIVNNPFILTEIYRILKKGGKAFVGGGFGKGVPDETINEIKEESKIQNDNLGRHRVTIDTLKDILKNVHLTEQTVISEEGGVWLLISKDL